MTVSTILSMSLFALAASLSPGPVNLVGVSCGARFGIRAGLLFVTGATIGFIALFLLIGIGLEFVVGVIPWLIPLLKWAGAAFLLYLACQLFIDNGELGSEQSLQVPTPWLGALMQWLNPKAWLASLSGIATYTAHGEANALTIFAGLYLLICWLSLATWVLAGAAMKDWLNAPQRIQLLNKALALALAISCIAMLY